MDLSHAIHTTGDRTRRTYDGLCGRSFPDYLKQVKPEIDERIMFHISAGGSDDIFDRRLETPLRHGKRMRAGLLMLIFDRFRDERSDREMALDLAAAVEIAHSASLIIDDMLDQDEARHGMRATHITMGQKNAVLGTVALLSYPYQIAARYGSECVIGMARTHRAMVRAATREMTGIPSFGVGLAYDSIIENKTGLLFALAGRFGAKSAGCSPAVVELAAEFGLLTGKTMQIADDITDLGQLMNGRSAGITGSEAILLRRCLGQTGDEEVPHGSADILPSGPIGTERRRDIEGMVGRYLKVSIEEAREAATRLDRNEPTIHQDDHEDRLLPDLTKVPGEIAGMMLRE